MEKKTYVKIIASAVFAFAFLVSAPQFAHAATLYFSPSSGSHAIGTTLSVSVYISSADQAMNAASGVIVFPQDKLEVASLSKTGSIFSLWVQDPSFSNTLGTVNFEGIVLNPGFTGSSGKVITITFKAKAAGSASLTFSSGSVLANDGKGTNILTGMADANFSIGAIGPRAPEIAVPSEEPIIVSVTHPDENQWYSNNSPEFSWALPSDVTAVRLLYDKNPASVPTVTYSPAISEKKLEDLSDGTHYFHVRFKNNYGWGEITHRKILIDTVPPEPFNIIFDNQDDPTNPRPIFNFETTDSLSGIKYYNVIFEYEDGTTTTTTTTPSDIKSNPYQPLPLYPGRYKSIVRAFDKAENFSKASTEFEILPIEAPKITKIPISVGLGEALMVEGKAPENFTARVYIQKGEGEPIFEETKVGSDGKWKLIYDKALAKGDYLVWAQTENEKGALSYPTEKHSVEVGLPPFLKIGKIAVDYLTTMITLIILLIGAGVVIFYAWYRISMWRKRLRKETGEVRENVTRAFRALREEVEEQIEFLDGKRGLNEDERKVRNKLKDALGISEEFIGKEIKDVEKELE